MAPFKGVLMWLDLPGFHPTLTVGSIVPLNETSWRSTVRAQVAAIDGRHAIFPIRSSRPPRGCRNHWKDSSASLQTWPRDPEHRYAPSAWGQSALPPAHLPPRSTSLFIFSFSPAAALWETAVSGCRPTVCNWSRCEKPLFLQTGSRDFNTASNLTEETSRADGKSGTLQESISLKLEGGLCWRL